MQPDAQKKIGGLSPVAVDVVKTVIYDVDYWTLLNQLIKINKPLVDAIGNLESREANLADCMLEFIRCARAMTRLELEDGEDSGFFYHAKAVFNRCFHEMNTETHSLALFLHPLCQCAAPHLCVHQILAFTLIQQEGANATSTFTRCSSSLSDSTVQRRNSCGTRSGSRPSATLMSLDFRGNGNTQNSERA